MFGDYVLWVNGQRVDEMDRYLMIDPTHDIMRSTVKSNMEGSNIKEMKFPLFIEQIPFCLTVFHNCITKFTRVSLAKYRVVVK